MKVRGRERNGGKLGGGGEKVEMETGAGSEEPPGLPGRLAFPSLWRGEDRKAARERARQRPDHVVNAERERSRRAERTWQGVLGQGGEEEGGGGVGRREERALREGKETDVERQGAGTMIPLLLIARGGGASPGYFLDGHGVKGFDVVLPRGWGKVFWHAMMRRSPQRLVDGFSPRPLGVREMEEAALELLLPAFPRDYPETQAGRQWWRERRREAEEMTRKQPPQKGGNREGKPVGLVWEGRGGGKAVAGGGEKDGKDGKEEEGREGEGREIIVIHKVRDLEEAVAVPEAQSGYVGRIFPRLNFRNKYRAFRFFPVEGPEGRIAPDKEKFFPPAQFFRMYARAVLRCPWGGRPKASAEIYLPSSEDYAVMRKEGGRRGSGERGGDHVCPVARSTFAPPSLPFLPPSSSPPSSPSSRTFDRLLVGNVTSGGFCLGEGYGVGLAHLKIEGLRLLQHRAGKGLEGERGGREGVHGSAMSALVWVRNPRSTTVFPARMGLQAAL